MNRIHTMTAVAAVAMMTSANISLAAEQTHAHDGAKPSQSALSAKDAKFVKEAAQGGMAEVELGKMASLGQLLWRRA